VIVSCKRLRRGKATDMLLEMLEQADVLRRVLLMEAKAVAPDGGVTDRLGQILARLPALMRAHLAYLEALLAAQPIDKGKAILAALDTTITMHPCADHLEVEVTGRPERLLLVPTSGGRRGSTEPLFGGWENRIRTPANGHSDPHEPFIRQANL
jgi:hypothetical protein